MRLETESIAYRDGDARLNGFLAVDADRAGKRPGVLVVHGGAGLDDHARGRARRFAESGFAVFACDMYGEGVTGNSERIMRHIGDLRSNRRALVRRVQSAIEILSSRPQVDGRIAAVGYCLGGMIVLEYARGGSTISGVVSVHGGVETTSAAQPSSIRARILVCHGALDPHVPMSQLTAFAEEMKNAGADYQLIVYGNAMHGFTHENATGQQPGVLYHAQTDARSSIAIHEVVERERSRPGVHERDRFTEISICHDRQQRRAGHERSLCEAAVLRRAVLGDCQGFHGRPAAVVF